MERSKTESLKQESEKAQADVEKYLQDEFKTLKAKIEQSSSQTEADHQKTAYVPSLHSYLGFG